MHSAWASVAPAENTTRSCIPSLPSVPPPGVPPNTNPRSLAHPRTSDVAGSPGACPGWAWPHRTTRDPVRCEVIPRPFPPPAIALPGLRGRHTVRLFSRTPDGVSTATLLCHSCASLPREDRSWDRLVAWHSTSNPYTMARWERFPLSRRTVNDDDWKCPCPCATYTRNPTLRAQNQRAIGSQPVNLS